MKNPQIAIVTGYEALFAYMLFPDGDAELIKRIDFRCDGQTKAPLLQWENNHNCYQAIIGMIEHILERYRPESWGLACRSEQCEKIRSLLPRHYGENLVRCLETDTEEINVSNVRARFLSVAESDFPPAEHV